MFPQLSSSRSEPVWTSVTFFVPYAKAANRLRLPGNRTTESISLDEYLFFFTIAERI